jgi:hypothetical protein
MTVPIPVRGYTINMSEKLEDNQHPIADRVMRISPVNKSSLRARASGYINKRGSVFIYLVNVPTGHMRTREN